MGSLDSWMNKVTQNVRKVERYSWHTGQYQWAIFPAASPSYTYSLTLDLYTYSLTLDLYTYLSVHNHRVNLFCRWIVIAQNTTCHAVKYGWPYSIIHFKTREKSEHNLSFVLVEQMLLMYYLQWHVCIMGFLFYHSRPSVRFDRITS